jgi:hypothetical protein
MNKLHAACERSHRIGNLLLDGGPGMLLASSLDERRNVPL